MTEVPDATSSGPVEGCGHAPSCAPTAIHIALSPFMGYIIFMPYADEAKQRQAQREWWRANYGGDPTFRRKELRRKKKARAAWTPKRRKQDRDYMREFMRQYRAKLKKEALREAKEAARTVKPKPATRTPKRAPRTVKPAARKSKPATRTVKTPAPAKVLKSTRRATHPARKTKKAAPKRAASRRRG